MALTTQNKKRALGGGSAFALATLLSIPALATPAGGEDIIRSNCLACHSETGDSAAPFSRISQQRKTPEGWQMSINRMQTLRGLQISSEDKQALIKYLADTQGLAPSETAGRRYALEQYDNVVEDNDPAYAQMCARCHSGARPALQRRTEQEWNRLVHFHLAQFPSLELHALARDRDWFGIAFNETVPSLAKDFPFDSPQWTAWKALPKAEFDGSWRVTGYLPGKGDYSGRMTVSKTAADQYSLSLQGQYADGTPISGEGKAIVYTGYEWRAQLEIDGVALKQVLAADASGETLSGRMFERQATDMGGALQAWREGAASQIVAVYPGYLRQGTEQELTIIGHGLEGDISLGAGAELVRVLERSGDSVRVLARGTSALGASSVSVGKASSDTALQVYDRLARVEVLPAEAVARVGGAGSKVPKVRATYRALGYAAGPDGQAGTEDDVRLGFMPASWSLTPFDEVAAEDKDLEFAGQIDAQGIFTPGDGGPNPVRKMSTNNAGNLNVVASVTDGEQTLEGQGHLLVSVQRFVDPVLE